MRCKIIILRHSQSTDNKKGIFSGWRDPALTAQGKAEARKISKQLKGVRIDAAFSSSRKRARQTLQIALGRRRVPTLIDDRLIERSYGTWQSQKKAAIAGALGEKAWQKAHRGYATMPPRGESVKMVEARVKTFIKELERFLDVHPCNVAISCHGNSMRPLRKHYQGLSNTKMMALENPQDRAIIVSYDSKSKLSTPFSQKELQHDFSGRRLVNVLLPSQLRPKF